MQQEIGKVKLSNVSLSYGGNVLYADFNACFENGINVILGKSGCGKTSLLNIIMGLVSFEGVCEAVRPSVVFSDPALAPITAENNVKAVLGKNCGKQAEAALKLAEIYDKRKQNASTLSDGEKQRVALARAFASGRTLMLLDEPFSRLDYGVKTQLYNTLIDYLCSTATTAILVTHDIDEALTLADRIYFLDGRPCSLQLVSELHCPQRERNIYDERHNEIRKRLQDLFAKNF